jgi:predicted alpha/beta hydrolase family esterase
MKHMTIKLLIPGLWNSKPEHWQSYWEKLPRFQRVNQRDWDTPRCEEWIAELDRVVVSLHFDVILVAHSLGCVTVAHWSRTYPDHAKRIKGALLVAPSDVEAPSFPIGSTGFLPMPLERLPFHSTVVCSSNDEWVREERAELFAKSWGSDLSVIDKAGHIGDASGLGMWPDGMKFVVQLEQASA